MCVNRLLLLLVLLLVPIFAYSQPIGEWDPFSIHLDGNNQSSWTPTTSLVPNLNADFLDSLTSADFVLHSIGTAKNSLLRWDNATSKFVDFAAPSGGAFSYYLTFNDGTDTLAWTLISAPTTPGLSTVLSAGNTSGAHNIIMADNQKIYFGTGSDSSITYDGTNTVWNPKEVGAGYLEVSSDLAIAAKLMSATSIDANQNTYINFSANDRMQMQAGGSEFLDANEGATDIFTLGNAWDEVNIQSLKTTVKLGGSSTQIPVGGTIAQNIASVSNTSTTETDLFTYTLPANGFSSDGESLQTIYGGQFAATVNNKRLRVYFAGTAIYDSGALAITAATDWAINVTVIKTSSSTARCITSISTSSATLIGSAQYTALTGLSFTGTNILKLTGQGGASSDITATLSKTKWEDNA